MVVTRERVVRQQSMGHVAGVALSDDWESLVEASSSSSMGMSQ